MRARCVLFRPAPLPHLLAVALAASAGSAARAQDSVDQRLKALEQEVKELKEAGPAKTNPDDLRVYWQDGIHLENAAKDVQLRIGGRFQVDALFGGSNDFGKAKNVEDGAELRRARIYLQGTVTDRYEFKFQYDFADTNKVKAADVWGEVKKIPAVGNFRVGQFYEPLSFEQNTSDFDADFMDRGAMNSLSPARNIGAALHNGWNNQLVAWIGVFVDDGSGDPSIVQSNGDHAITSRVAGLPYHSEDDSSLIHVGVSGSYRTPTRNTVQYVARPDSHLAPVFIDTGVLNDVSSVELIDGEFAAQAGPIHGSAEYLASRLDADALNDPSFAGYNFAAGWFMTGEHLAYNHVDGVFGAPNVGKSLGRDGGFGAVELVARYSNLNLNGGTVRAHEIANTIVGVNWYLSNSVKFAVDGVHSHVQTQGSVNLLELWFQVTF
jgi:phosphate-selective porin OprO/OprP